MIRLNDLIKGEAASLIIQAVKLYFPAGKLSPAPFASDGQRRALWAGIGISKERRDGKVVNIKRDGYN